jgi:hypothetical protein
VAGLSTVTSGIISAGKSPESSPVKENLYPAFRQKGKGREFFLDLPSAQNNSCVRKGYLGVTYSGFLP